jgi:hypothetical protein
LSTLSSSPLHQRKVTKKPQLTFKFGMSCWLL